MDATYRNAAALAAWQAIDRMSDAARCSRMGGDDLRARAAEGFMEATYAAYADEFKALGMTVDPRKLPR